MDLLNAWRRKVVLRVDEIDPNKEFNWESVAFGYFYAKTQDISRAKGLAYEVWKKDLLGRTTT